MVNKPAINRPAPTGVDPPSGVVPTLRTIGVLADVEWLRGPVIYTDQPGRGFVTCQRCVEGTAHELYRPVPAYSRMVVDYLKMHEPADVVELITSYGFPVARHGDRRQPAQTMVSALLFRVADMREFRRLALEPPSHRLLDDAELLVVADTFRAKRERVFQDAERAGASRQEGQARAEALVPSLSVDAHWRESAVAAGQRRTARDQLTASVKEMKVRWRLEPGEAVVELVPTSVLQLVSYALLLELRGDEAVGHCLECHRQLPSEEVRPGRPRLYCLPDLTNGRDCAGAAATRRRREARRVARSLANP